MGGENWETRRGRSRAGLLRSPRDLHFVFATFGARQSLRKFAPLLALLGTALATLGRSRALLAGYVQAVPRSAKSGTKLRRDCRASKVARSKSRLRPIPHRIEKAQ